VGACGSYSRAVCGGSQKRPARRFSCRACHGTRRCASQCGGGGIVSRFAQVMFIEVMTLVVSPSGVVGLRKLSERATPASLVALSEVFELLDAAVAACGVYKVETIGSEFMAVSGLPAACPQPRNTSQRMLRAAIAMLMSVKASDIETVCLAARWE
jgi:class 3 adenylate cyclase